MSGEEESPALRQMTRMLRRGAKVYLRFKHPKIVAVAGSVGKTSTKIMIGKLLASERRVSYMDDSYNYGLGLYLSVFEQKVPTRLTSPLSWLGVWAKVTLQFLKRRPEIMVLEYGIDNAEQMDQFLQFARPDVSILTAVTPEHMEFLKDIETVAREETKVLHAAKDFALVNLDDIEPRFIPDIPTLEFYGSSRKALYHYQLRKVDARGALIDLQLGEHELKNVRVQLISEHMVRQLCGAAALAWRLGTSLASIKQTLPTLQPTPGRMRLFKGVQNSSIIDDSANFSPTAGVRALETLKAIKAKRHIVVFGNMHELGDYETVGFQTVARELNNIDLLVLVGPLAKKYFGKLAKQHGFEAEKNMFFFGDAISAGKWLRGQLKSGDAVLVKGPFGGFYLEECTKLLLANPRDARYLTRQSKFWLRKKQAHFGQMV